MRKITRNRLKEIVRETIVEENEYQAFFQKCLAKAGGSITAMGTQEKKDFFNKIDSAWNSRGEKRGNVKEKVLPQLSSPVLEKKVNEDSVPRGFKALKMWSQLPSAKEIKINTGSIVKPKYEKAKVWQHQSSHVILSYGKSKTRRVDKSQGLSNIYIKESVNESTFKVDDVVYNKRTKTIGIVRLADDKHGEAKTDADGNVDVDELEFYNPMKNSKHKSAKVAPSTKKEIDKRSLWKPFAQRESVNEYNAKDGIQVEKSVFDNKTEGYGAYVRFGAYVKIIPVIPGATEKTVRTRANKLYASMKKWTKDDEKKAKAKEDKKKVNESKPVKGRKSFYTMDNVGASKYTINDYDGKATHKDGSVFYGIETFKNKKKYEAKKKELKKQGYIEESITEDAKKVWKVGKGLFVDSDFVNFSKGKLPNSELKHAGMGDFFLDTPNGKIYFIRAGEKLNGMSGRSHRISDNEQNGKLIAQLIKKMGAKIVQESVNESLSNDDIEIIKSIVRDGKPLLQLSGPLKKAGFVIDTIIMDMIPPHIKVYKKKGDKKHLVLIDKSNVTGPDFTIGKVAGGLTEGLKIRDLKK